ncbi:MAG: NAD(P)H-hydrate epimerase [Flavobacteriales bacterium]
MLTLTCIMMADTYFGFSQRLPLPPAVEDAIEQCNSMQSVKLSLDIPTGLSEAAEEGFFQSDVICTLAAPKKVLYHPLLKARIFVADIGIPLKIYRECRAGFELPFDQGSILQLLTI